MTKCHMAVGQNQWCHFGLGAPPNLEPFFSGELDVHWGYGFLTKGNIVSPNHVMGLHSFRTAYPLQTVQSPIQGKTIELLGCSIRLAISMVSKLPSLTPAIWLEPTYLTTLPLAGPVGSPLLPFKVTSQFPPALKQKKRALIWS